MNENQKKAAREAAEAGIAAASGDYADAVMHFVEGALSLWTPDAVRKVVDDATVRRANALADAIENERFGPEKKP